VIGFGGTASYDSTLNGKVLDLAIREAVDNLVGGVESGALRLADQARSRAHTMHVSSSGTAGWRWPRWRSACSPAAPRSPSRSTTGAITPA
jgi:hypothetical protein